MAACISGSSSPALWLSQFLSFAEANTWTAPVLVDELNAGLYQRVSNFLSSRFSSPKHALGCFKPFDGRRRRLTRPCSTKFEVLKR